MNVLKYLCLILSCLLISCGGLYSYHQGTKPAHVSNQKVIDIYLDSSFDLMEREHIKDAMNEWNGVFNGQIKLQLAEKDGGLVSFSGKDEASDLLKMMNNTGLGWLIIKLNSSDELLEDVNTNTLAFVTGADRHLMVVIADRVTGRNLKTIIMHEMGHLLGAAHINSKGSLMNPTYGFDQVDCIDKMTVSQIAGYWDFPITELNYCITPNFE